MFFFTLFYLLLSFLLMYPPVEFVSAGLTIPSIFSKFLGSEGETFVEYHVIRIIITIFIHSCLPLGYIVGYFFSDPETVVSLFWNEPSAFWWRLYLTIAIMIPLIAASKIVDWSRNGWEGHPVSLKLKRFCNPDSDWTSVASNVNIEFRRFDKVSILINSTSKAYVTDSWIIKIGIYNLDFAHQSDAMLIVNNSDTHQITPTGSGELQFINIEVKSIRNKIPPFNIRLIAQDFNELQDKVQRPIIILPNIVFHKTITDKFIDVFKDQVALNEKYTSDRELELCIGCMQERSNIKLFKQCVDTEEPRRGPEPRPSPCTQCNCRPMWCIDCMARWFASRQDPEQTDKWLSSKCTCPVCRATFCLLDVAYVQV